MAIYGEMTYYYVENRRIPYPKVQYNNMCMLIFICNLHGYGETTDYYVENRRIPYPKVL